MQSVRVIAGLGNPGPSYDGTRHNIGFALVDYLAGQQSAKWQSNDRFSAHTATIELSGFPVLLLKPQTFMNLSGKAVSAVCRYFKWHPQSVLVAYDEYTLPLGRVKLTQRGSAGGHNGMDHILNLLGDGIPRFRIGIGPEHKPDIALTDYVLGKFTDAEAQHLSTCWNFMSEQIETVIRLGPTLAANQINKRIQSNKPNNDA